MFPGKKSYWVFQLSGWGALFLLHLFFAWFYGKFETQADQRIFLLRACSFITVGFLFTHLMRLIILRAQLLTKKASAQVIYFIILSISTALVCGFCEQQIFKKMNLLTPREWEMLSRRGIWLVSLGNTLSWLLYIFIWNAMYLMMHYGRDYQQQQIDTLQLKAMVKDLELKTIKSNINPHFIFNALNSIRALVDENPGRARDAITELSNILRSSITMHKTELVVLHSELDIVKDYLALEQMRFEDRLRVTYQIDAATLPLQIPPMMLQTLVENAIKHGISTKIEGGRLLIGTALKDQHLEFYVKNTGMLKDDAHQGFGLQSIRERLRLLFPSNSQFKIEQTGSDMVEASVRIPANS